MAKVHKENDSEMQGKNKNQTIPVYASLSSSYFSLCIYTIKTPTKLI